VDVLIISSCLNDEDSEGSAKKARQEDMTGASLAEIEEIMNFGMRKKRRRRMVWHLFQG
jgi:general transcription factor 3C polypeptide 3 (transcription factor C subunit 4)